MKIWSENPQTLWNVTQPTNWGYSIVTLHQAAECVKEIVQEYLEKLESAVDLHMYGYSSEHTESWG